MNENAQSPETPGRRPYRSPELRDLGTLSEVTASNPTQTMTGDGVAYTS